MKPTPYVYEWDRRVRSRKYHRKAAFWLIAGIATLVLAAGQAVAGVGHWSLFAIIPLVGLMFALRAGYCFAIAKHAER